MHSLSTILILLAALLFTLASANTLHFYNNDKHRRWVCFTADKKPGPHFSQDLKGILLYPFTQQVYPNIPFRWSGTFHTIFEGGNCNAPAVIGEVTFQGDRGRTFYDVSAIDSHDNNGVKFVRPEYHWNVPNAISGCDVFPCPNAYLVHDSPKQTRDTEDTDLVVMIGG